VPHFVVDCSEAILSAHDEASINTAIHKAANSSGLFNESNIQVRINAFKTNLVGNNKVDFIQVFASILEGRTKDQKAGLSRAVVETLVEMFPEVEIIGIDILDLEKGAGFNKGML